MQKSHDGRVAVVTGAARGIGQAIALKLAVHGADMVLVDLLGCEGTAAKIRESTGKDALSLVADVTSQDDWNRLAKTVDDRFGHGDIVVNNAGIIPEVPFDELDGALWQKTFSINVDSHFFSAKAFVPMMQRDRWGRFVNVSSSSIGSNIPGLSQYMASKMAVLGFVRGLANDLGDDGITVNAVLPGLTETPGTALIPADKKRIVATMTQAIKRVSRPDDIAGPVVFLTSEDAGFITGQALVVDGGAYKIS